MNSVEVSSAGVDPPSWGPRCAAFVRKVLKAREIRDWEVSILLCDDATIRQLNRRYRDLDEPTDVLAFGQGGRDEPVGEDPVRFPPATGASKAAGDIVISVETMRRNAGALRIAEQEELKRLLIHGILHLEGLDHPEADADMIAMQERILASFEKERVF